MSYNVSGTDIILTRGDTFIGIVSATQKNGEPYEFIAGDKVRFAMKSKYTDAEPILNIDIPIDTMELVIKPEDTKNLKFGNYVYDIQLTKANGVVDTFITKASIKITEEVD